MYDTSTQWLEERGRELVEEVLAKPTATFVVRPANTDGVSGVASATMATWVRRLIAEKYEIPHRLCAGGGCVPLDSDFADVCRALLVGEESKILWDDPDHWWKAHGPPFCKPVYDKVKKTHPEMIRLAETHFGEVGLPNDAANSALEALHKQFVGWTNVPYTKKGEPYTFVMCRNGQVVPPDQLVCLACNRRLLTLCEQSRKHAKMMRNFAVALDLRTRLPKGDQSVQLTALQRCLAELLHSSGQSGVDWRLTKLQKEQLKKCVENKTRRLEDK